MNSNLDKIAQELYGKIQTRFPSIKIGDENATVLSKKEDIPNARFFEFEYEEGGEPLGTIAITLDADDGIVVQVSGDLVNDGSHSTHHGAFKFIRSFRQFAKDRLLNFDIQNIGKNNLDKRDYQFQAKRKEEPMEPIMENKLYGTNKISYQDLGEARLIIKHNQAVNANLPAGRTMHIESIYVENAQGERFRYPYKHLSGARALAEHIKHGGIPYDAIGKHIIGLSEELAGLRKFKGYVSRQEQLSEAMSSVTSKVMERIEQVKKEIHNLQRSAYYEQFAESFEEQDEQILPEELVNDLVNRLTIRTFNEELKSVFPYIAKFVNENELPVLEVGADDLLGETDDNEFCDACDRPADKCVCDSEKNESFDPEFAFESFIDNIIREDKDELFSPNKDAQQAAIEKLNQILAKELKGGPEGVNAINSLKGLIDDPEFLMSLRDIDPDLDVRPLIQQYVTQVDANVATQLHFGGEEGGAQEPEAQAAAPAPAPAPEAPPAPTPDMAAAAPAPAEAPPEQPAPAPVAEGKKKEEDDDSPPWDEDPKEKKSKPTTPGKYGQGYSQARHLARQGMADAIKKAQKAGATLETQLDFGHKTMTLHDAIKECGMDPSEFGFEQEESGIDQMLNFVSGFYNKDEGNFPLGGQRIKIKVKKAFEDGEFGNASPEELMKVLKFIDTKDPSSDEQHHILKLAGVRRNDVAVDEQGANAQVDKLNALLAQLQNMQKQAGQGASSTSSHTQTGTINGQPANYDDAMNKFKQMKIKFGDDEIDFNDPDQAGEKMKGIMGGMMKGMQGQVPNQNIQFPGGQMNPADMFQQIMKNAGLNK